MRIGLMIGSDKERARGERLAGLVADVQAAERAGFTSIWVPQIPGDFDAMTAIALMGQATDAHRARHRGHADPDPSSDRDGAAGAVEPGGVRGPLHARPRAVAPLDRRGTCSASRTSARPHLVRELPRGAERGVRGPGPGRRRERRVPRAQPDGRHRPSPTPSSRRARARDAAHRRRARRRDDPLDGRRAGDRRARRPAHHEGRGRAGRPAPRIVAGVPVALCADDEVDAARAYANQVLGHAEFSPNYQRLLEHGDAEDVGDIMAAGTSPPSSSACAASATPASPTSPPACCRSATTPRHASSHGSAPRRSSPRSAPSSEGGAQRTRAAIGSARRPARWCGASRAATSRSYGSARCSTPRLSQITVSPTSHSWRYTRSGAVARSSRSSSSFGRRRGSCPRRARSTRRSPGNGGRSCASRPAGAPSVGCVRHAGQLLRRRVGVDQPLRRLERVHHAE